MYHGFRYLEIFGLLQTPSKEDIVGHRIRIDALPAGQLDVSVPLFNDIHRIIKQSVQNQMYSVLTDCPTREKMGWLD
jgi:alpha-L-rhamnosidase